VMVPVLSFRFLDGNSALSLNLSEGKLYSCKIFVGIILWYMNARY
jgi:hypothetical protein